MQTLLAIGREWCLRNGLTPASTESLGLHDWSHDTFEKATGLRFRFKSSREDSTSGWAAEMLQSIFVYSDLSFDQALDTARTLASGFTLPSGAWATFEHLGISQELLVHVYTQGRVWRAANPDLQGYLR